MADPRYAPKNIRKTWRNFGDAWWYEDEKGVEIIHEICHDSGAYIRTESFRIPWGQLLRAAQRSSKRKIVVKEAK